MSGWGHPLKTLAPRPFRVGDRLFGGDRPALLGIVNVTPDSFFDGGRHASLEAALRHCDKLVEDGADLLDIGGESSRPGARPIGAEEEAARVVPLVREAAKRFPVPLSIDTVKSEVARRALDAGALVVNDISAMTADPFMLELPAAYGASVVLNHMQGEPPTMQKAPRYQDVTREVRGFLFEQVRALAAFGLSKDRIAVDPGIGFGKRLEDNQALLSRLEELDPIGCAVLVGASRKSFIGKTPGLEASDRLFPSVAAALFCAFKGASLLRVHDVRETREALLLADSLVRAS